MAISLLDTMLIHVVVYWPPLRNDEHGNKRFGTPIEIKARWEYATRELLDERGNVTSIMSKVYLAEDVQQLGVLWLSTAKPSDPGGTALAQLTDATKPFRNAGAGEIRKFAKTFTIDGTQALRTVYL